MNTTPMRAIIRPFLCVLTILGCCLLLGCARSNGKPVQANATSNSRSASEAPPGLPDAFATLLTTIANPECTEAQFAEALARLAHEAVLEPPTFWVTVVDDARMSHRRRRLCLAQMFKRHFSGPSPISKLGKLVGARGWFTEATLTTATVYSSVPVARGNGSIFMMKLSFMDEEQSAAYFRVNRYISKKTLLALLNGEASDQTILMTEIAVVAPRSERMP